MKKENDSKVLDENAGPDLAKTSGASPPEGTQMCYSDENNSSLKTELKEFVNSDDAAKFLGISKKTLHNLCSMGLIPFYKFGRRNRYRKDELKALLQAEPRGGRK